MGFDGPKKTIKKYFPGLPTENNRRVCFTGDISGSCPIKNPTIIPQLEENLPNIGNYSLENKIKTNENPQKICLINRTH